MRSAHWGPLPLRITAVRRKRLISRSSSGKLVVEPSGPVYRHRRDVAEERRVMKPGWAALDGVSADRLWLRPLGLISGRAAAEAIASGYARPLTGPSLAFSLLAALGLGSDRRPDLGDVIDCRARGMDRRGRRTLRAADTSAACVSIRPATAVGRVRSRSPGRHGRPQRDARQLLRRRTVV